MNVAVPSQAGRGRHTTEDINQATRGWFVAKRVAQTKGSYPMTSNEDVAVKALVSHLFEKSNDYRGIKPVEEIVKAKVRALANEIADEIIAGLPGLREVLRSRMAAMIERVIADDPYVDEHLADAVAKGLRKLAKVEEL